MRRGALGWQSHKKLPQLDLLDDKAGKPVGIQKHIGRRPLAAFGNSDGDLEMLQMDDRRARAALHADRPSHRRRARMGVRPQIEDRYVDKAWNKAPAKGWAVVDMKRDWKKVFAFE
jgi:hypothetical protein